MEKGLSYNIKTIINDKAIIKTINVPIKESTSLVFFRNKSIDNVTLRYFKLQVLPKKDLMDFSMTSYFTFSVKWKNKKTWSDIMIIPVCVLLNNFYKLPLMLRLNKCKIRCHITVNSFVTLKNHKNIIFYACS